MYKLYVALPNEPCPTHRGHPVKTLDKAKTIATTRWRNALVEVRDAALPFSRSLVAIIKEGHELA